MFHCVNIPKNSTSHVLVLSSPPPPMILHNSKENLNRHKIKIFSQTKSDHAKELQFHD